MKNLLICALIILPLTAGAKEQKSIYGSDNRQELFASSSEMQKLADSVVSLWESKNVAGDGKTFRLNTMNFGQALNLCATERFRDQPIGAFCSGTLVGEDIVMTAGHCITNEIRCADTKFVFGFAVKSTGGQAVTSMPVSEVYGCKKIIKRDLSTQPTGFGSAISALIGSMINGGTGPDYALVQLDRKVTGHKPLAINRKQRLAKGDPMFVIGHPVGLPLKVAGDAKVRDAGPRYFFMTDLDTFGGNSGSAVFNARTNLIEGILVRGGTDFVQSPTGGCTVSYQVGQEEGKGEAVTKISALAEYIPALKGAAISAGKNAAARGVEVKDSAPGNDLLNKTGEIKFQ